jgi:hypothetical protein
MAISGKPLLQQEGLNPARSLEDSTMLAMLRFFYGRALIARRAA